MASAIHRCQHCGYETDLSSNLAVFEDNPHCRQCGLSAYESDIKMQDDLINMMARNLQISPLGHQHDLSMPPTPQVVPEPEPITYISQHYHHSAHQVPLHDLPVSTILEKAGINAAALFPSQLQLFKNAQPEQRLRLIELWQIAPPTYGNQMHPDDMANWPQSSMEKEEEAAKYRLKGTEQERQPKHDNRNNAEPYMLQGYDTLPNINGVAAPMQDGSNTAKIAEYRQSNDPAYKSREWWNFSGEAEPMEHQYGMLQQMYGFFDYSTARRNDGDAEMS
ncbi:hypothetical protein A1O3_07686 [Capronia epimyces CBS 606.96]|uniref:Uncharacterized protein n=1 Tax=Capronia epimyces CBS 606.96 TaxID=1182542 RepID=W9XVP5_9EURO|nr:uncharacterized protein A1O3_07686 [Capronia epimyces CBS 606.96]EXJ81395.1 hypothetical protein A1O3_07686 [Capronia epimyces CBS 606.96]